MGLDESKRGGLTNSAKFGQLHLPDPEANNKARILARGTRQAAGHTKDHLKPRSLTDSYMTSYEAGGASS